MPCRSIVAPCPTTIGYSRNVLFPSWANTSSSRAGFIRSVQFLDLRYGLLVAAATPNSPPYLADPNTRFSVGGPLPFNRQECHLLGSSGLADAPWRSRSSRQRAY